MPQRHGGERVAGELAAERHRHARRVGRTAIIAERPQERPRQRIEAPGDQHVAAVARGHELQEVVRADRDEIGDAARPSSWKSIAGTSTIAPIISFAGSRMAVPARDAQARAGSAPRARANLVELGDHRQHDAELAVGRGLEKRARSACAAAPADRAPSRMARQPMRRILLLLPCALGQHLVAAEIERAEDDRLARPPPRSSMRRSAADRRACGMVRRIMNCSSVRNRPMPSAPDFGEMRQVDEQAGIHHQRDRARRRG